MLEVGRACGRLGLGVAEWAWAAAGPELTSRAQVGPASASGLGRRCPAASWWPEEGESVATKGGIEVASSISSRWDSVRSPIVGSASLVAVGGGSGRRDGGSSRRRGRRCEGVLDFSFSSRHLHEPSDGRGRRRTMRVRSGDGEAEAMAAMSAAAQCGMAWKTRSRTREAKKWRWSSA